MVETNFKVSGCRCLPTGANGFAKSVTASSSVATEYTDRIRIRNQGNKRTAIWGVKWYVAGLNATTLANTQIRIFFDYYEKALNGKFLSTNLHNEAIVYRATGDTFSNPASGQIWFTNPFMAKDGHFKLTISFTADANTPTYLFILSVMVSDAVIDSDMGDAALAGRFNRGDRRCKIVGETRLLHSKKQGWV